jgi:uncharacterized membrane protein
MADKPDKEILDAWYNDPANWKLWVFYYNPKDKRILPPKRSRLGWTINFANPYSVMVLIGALVLIALIERYTIL